MRAILFAALLAGATLAHAQTKKELVAKLLQLQQGGVENVAREMVSRPAAQMLQAAGQALVQVPPERREATARALEAEARRFAEDATPAVRDQALKLAPSTYGAGLEEKFSEDELKQLIAWHDSAVARKYQKLAPELQNGFAQKLAATVGPQLEAKLQALQERLGKTLATAAAAPASPASGATRPPGK